MKSQDIDAFLSICAFKTVKNKETIFKAGSTARKGIFILSGFVRGYIINKEGKEKNIILRAQDSFTCPPEWLHTPAPTKYTFESILKSEVLIFNLTDFETLAKKNEALFDLYTGGLKNNINMLMYRIESLIFLSPEERYKDLLDKYPYLFQKAFNKHIANFLGITPVSLSRILKRMKENH